MSSWFNELKSLRVNVLQPTFHELMRSMPDSLFLGTSTFALLTQNFPLGILVLAMAEFSILHRFFGAMLGLVQKNEKVAQIDACIPGIPSPYQISVIGKLLISTSFPSGPVFFISAVILYTMLSIFNFQGELAELGKKESQWKTRLPLSIAFNSLLLLLFITWRYANSCDGIFTILGSTLFGFIAGGMVYLIHVYLFGRDSINFLGIPLLADRAANGRPLYVCAKSAVNTN